MTTQLRLVEAPAPARTRATPRRQARAVPRRARRAVRWTDDWRLDADARRIGRAGVAAARASLGKAADATLPQAS